MKRHGRAAYNRADENGTERADGMWCGRYSQKTSKRRAESHQTAGVLAKRALAPESEGENVAHARIGMGNGGGKGEKMSTAEFAGGQSSVTPRSDTPRMLRRTSRVAAASGRPDAGAKASPGTADPSLARFPPSLRFPSPRVPPPARPMSRARAPLRRRRARARSPIAKRPRLPSARRFHGSLPSRVFAFEHRVFFRRPP